MHKSARAFLSSYRPICGNRAGRLAIQNYNIPKFVDGSCRREPDFESSYPSLSAVCRAGKFVARLKEEDHIIYMTHKGKYFSERERHWRLVAVLKVIKRFESHSEAANWYRQNNCALPSNCIVDVNPPYSLDKTDRHGNWRDVDAWDRFYRRRVRRCGVFLVCKPLYVELSNPPMISPKYMQKVFGRKPITRNPPSITWEQYDGLLALLPLP